MRAMDTSKTMYAIMHQGENLIFIFDQSFHIFLYIQIYFLEKEFGKVTVLEIIN